MIKRKKKQKRDVKIFCSENHSSNGVYGLGFVGAVIYYVSTASGFWMGVLGILKSIVWPAFLVFEILKFLGA
jgi:hypothetical protein